jgi:hypothetical protein
MVGVELPYLFFNQKKAFTMLIKLKTGKRKGAVIDVPYWVGKDQIRRGNATEYKPPKAVRKSEKAAALDKTNKKADKESEQSRSAAKTKKAEEPASVSGAAGAKMADKPENKLLVIDKKDK